MHDPSRCNVRNLFPVAKALLLGAAVIAFGACSDSGGGTNPGSFSIAVDPTSMNVAPGGTGNATVTVTRSGSFAGAVNLAASGQPTGVTVTFDPTTIDAASTTSTMTVTVAASIAAGPGAGSGTARAVAPGDYPIVVTASASGQSDQTATMTLTVTSASNGSFTLAANPATGVALTAGTGSHTSTITVTRNAPFAGAVALTATTPPNITATFNPTSIAADSTTSVMTLSAGASAANGAYSVTVRGTSSGVPDATTTVAGTVTGGAAAGITLAAAPASVTVAQNANFTDTIKVTRNGGFTGAVSVAISGLPTGVTATPNPLSIAAGANSGTVSIAASNSAAAGTTNLTLTGSGTGISNATVSLPVTVTTGSGGGITVAFCAENAPVWVAARDGTTGSFNHLTPTSGNTYTFNFPSGKGGVAVVDTSNGGYSSTIIYATTAEFTVQGQQAAANCGGNKTVNGSVANVAAGQIANISLGNASAFVVGGTSNNFQLMNVKNGNQELVASRADAASFTTNKIIIRHNLNIADGGTISPILDFNGSEAITPLAANVTIAGLGAGETASVLSLFTTPNGGSGTLSFSSDVSNGTLSYSGIPAANLGTGGIQVLEAFAAPAGGNNSRIAGVYQTTPAARTLTIPPTLSTPTVTDVTTPYDQPSMSLTSQAQYDRLAVAEYSEGTGSTSRDATVILTAAYLGGRPTTWSLVYPDLSGVAGWLNTYGLQTAHANAWAVTALGGTNQFINVPANGDTFAQGNRQSPSTSPPLASRSRFGVPNTAVRTRNSEGGSR